MNEQLSTNIGWLTNENIYATNEYIYLGVTTNTYHQPHKPFLLDSPYRIEVMIVVVVASLWAKWSRRK